MIWYPRATRELPSQTGNPALPSLSAARGRNRDPAPGNPFCVTSTRSEDRGRLRRLKPQKTVDIFGAGSPRSHLLSRHTMETHMKKKALVAAGIAAAGGHSVPVRR